MGGKAFANRKPPLSTPRMPPSVYFAVRSSVMQSLGKLFTHAMSPLPLPKKPSHGDIDILVCEPRPPYILLAKSLADTASPLGMVEETKATTAITPVFLQEHLHAEAHINSSTQSKTFAIPYPELLNTYIQVDVTILPSLQALTWHLTSHSYGALFTVIGSIMCKPNGLTVNDKGLYLRILEIEKEDKKRASVLLTADWDVVMDVLGLDVKAFKRGFEEVSDIWAWIAAARLFDREDVGYKERNAKKRKGGNGEIWESFESWLVERVRQLGIERSEDESSHLEDERRNVRERRREVFFEEIVERFEIKDEVQKRVSVWRAEKQDLEHKRVRKAARKKAFEEDERYGNAWIGCLNGRVASNEREFAANTASAHGEKGGLNEF